MTPEVLSVHSFTGETDISFNTTDYSRLKYGDDKIAHVFSKEMAQNFIRHMTTSSTPGPFPIIAVATSKETLETAASRLAYHFTLHLNRWLAARDQGAVIELQIHRQKKSTTAATFTQDYGALSVSDRHKRLDNDFFHLDTKLITNDMLILIIDDIRITGLHEHFIRNMFRDQNISNKVIFFYYAQCCVDNLDSLDPTIETRLNEAAISPPPPPATARADTFDNLKSVIVESNKNFILNQRLIKRLLKADHERFCRFLGAIEQTKPLFGSTLYDLAVKNGYHQVAEYQPNIEILRVFPSPSWSSSSSIILATTGTSGLAVRRFGVTGRPNTGSRMAMRETVRRRCHSKVSGGRKMRAWGSGERLRSGPRPSSWRSIFRGLDVRRGERKVIST